MHTPRTHATTRTRARAGVVVGYGMVWYGMVWYGGRYEVLSDEDKRKWYNQGGILLVKNMETV